MALEAMRLFVAMVGLIGMRRRGAPLFGICNSQGLFDRLAGVRLGPNVMLESLI